MRYLSRALLAFLAAGTVAVFWASPAGAAQTSNSEFVIIPEGDVFPEDLYAGAIRVVIEGTLDGDLIAFAAEEILINGTVTGSVTAVTPKLTVNGEVGGSLRMAGNRLEVTGQVGGDVVAVVVDAELTPTSRVTGDVLVWAWNAMVLGEIGADLTGTQRNLDLAGSVGGDVEVSVSRLRVVDDLSVGGDLGYRSAREADGLDRATVEGAIVAKSPLPPNLRVRALALLGRFLVIVFLSVAALATAYGWPERTKGAITEVRRSPVRNWLTGALILFSPAIVMAITGLILGLAPAAAAFPLLAVLVPVILALFSVCIALSFVAGAPVAGWLGGVLFKRLDVYGSLLGGGILIGVIWYLPYVGWLAPVVVLPWGLGSWIATWRNQASAEPSGVEVSATS